MPKPLENIKVLDLTRVLAGPFCTMLLSDLGAEIIKVEIPDKGDDSRYFGPFKNDISLYFASVNRGKKSISLNLKTEKGKEILKELVKKVDIIIENYRPGTMEKLGLGYEILKKINPKIIYAATSGFGHTGPESKKPAYDILVQALGGVMSITGWPDSPPTRVGMSLGDITASLYTAIGINAALYQRETTKKGQKIDVAMLDCQLSILENALARYQVDKISPEPIGNRHPTVTPFQAFKAKDGYVIIAIGNDVLWTKFCTAINREDLKENKKFITNQLRTDNIDELTPVLEKEFKKKSAKQWMKILEEAAIPHAKINKIEEIMKNKQLKARNMFVDTKVNGVGTLKIAGNPIKMTSIKETKTRKSPPEIGEDNMLIYCEMLGLSKKDIENLKKDGVI